MPEITDLLWAAHDDDNLINLKSKLEKENKTVIEALPPLNRMEAFSGNCSSTKSFEKLFD